MAPARMPQPARAPAAEVAADRQALPESAEDWPGFIAGLKLIGMAAQLAAQTQLQSVKGNALTLALPAAHKHLADKAYADKLKVALEQATGRKLLLAFEVGAPAETSLAATERRERAAAQASGEAAFRDEPFVRDLLARVRRSGAGPTPSPRSLAIPIPDEGAGARMMKNQLAGLMKQAQQMQDNMKRAQEELAQTEVEGQAGAGLVKVTMTCRHDVKRVAIDPSLLAEDRDMLEDLVAAAVNDAVRRVEATTQEKMSRTHRRHAAAAGLQDAVLTTRAGSDPVARRPPSMSARAFTPQEPLGSLDGLTTALRCLPGVGPKAAQRMALHLMQHDRDGARALGGCADARGAVASATASAATPSPRTMVCAMCRSDRRDPALLCVVETPADLLMVEHTQAYSGLYFVLMGRLSPLDGIGPKEIRLDRLLKRVGDGSVREVILATNFTHEGEATAHYIGELLRARGLKTTRLARGVPVGGELEYVDAGTLAQALRERRPLAE